MKKGKTLIIFDIDGTLIYSNKVDSQCFAIVYHKIYGVEFPTIDWTKFPHVTDTTIFRTAIWQHFNRAATEAEMIDFQQEFVAMLEEKRLTHPHEFDEVPGARQTIINLLQDERFVVGIGTGGWLSPAKVKLGHAKIPFAEIVVAGADGHEQRETIIGQVVDTVAQQVEIERTVYVGDAVWDANTTRRLGMNFLGIRRNGDLEVLQSEGTKIVLKDYSDYGNFIQSVFETTPPLNKHD